MTWEEGTFAQGGDKQWMVIDKRGSIGRGNIYAYWTQIFSVCSPGFFTRSYNRGISFANCTIIPDETMRWGTLAVGPEGELYACGWSEEGFVVTRSVTARDSSQAVTWDLSAIVNLDGMIGADGGPNPGGLLGQAWVAVDISDGPLRGNIYLLCSVQRFSTTDPLDVMFARSTDGGETWSEPVRINDDTTDSAWQWFGTMSVAPNGRLDVIWLDTRDNLGGFTSSLYYSNSFDGGVTWSANERLSAAFDPHVGWPRQDKIGDYFHLISEDTRAHLAWAATFNGEQDVYYSRIAAQTVSVREQKTRSASTKNFTVAQNYPNPFNSSTTIQFSLPSESRARLKVYNAFGKEVATLLDQQVAAGTHKITWNASPLASGIYVYRLEAGGLAQTGQLLLMK